MALYLTIAWTPLIISIPYSYFDLIINHITKSIIVFVFQFNLLKLLRHGFNEHIGQLQLLIITPAKDIHVVEPFISACHYVFNNQEGNNSQVYNMNMTQYYAQKAAFAEMAAE